MYEQKILSEFVGHIAAGIVSIILILCSADRAVGMDTQVDYKIRKTIEFVNDVNIQRTIEQLQQMMNRSSWEKQRAAINWLSSEFKENGNEVTIQEYQFREMRWPNIIVTFTGKSAKKDEIIMLIAHVDSISRGMLDAAPGADDDASGVAVLLELARILQGATLERTVMICIFTNEEQGAAGSKYFASQAKKKGLNIRAVINLDILGYNRPQRYLYISAIQAQGTIKHKIKAFYRMNKNYFNGYMKGRNTVKVVGRRADGFLVSKVSLAFQKYTDLNVVMRTNDDCG